MNPTESRMNGKESEVIARDLLSSSHGLFLVFQNYLTTTVVLRISPKTVREIFIYARYTNIGRLFY